MTILCISKQLLYGYEIVSCNNAFMVVFHSILITVLTILFRFVVQIVRCESLTGQHITTMPLVLENLHHSGWRPFDVAPFGAAIELCERLCDLFACIPIKVKKKD